MTEKTENKVETLPDLDDLLQCPVCYEIPSGQIFQCNEGHHVCGRCKMRLDVCPVCRAFFFGTRNYAMEELISNVRKLQAFKLGGKVTTGTPPTEDAPEARESSSEDSESAHEDVIDEDEVSSRTSARAPTSCRGLFRCLCCKNNPERLPLGRLLNHLRYYHSPDLIEGRSENGGYIQAWQFPTAPGKLVTAVRVHDMGIFFLVIEVTSESVHAWLSMAASPWAAHEFSYSFILSGNDREAIFTDCVWSVRACEGSLKRRGRCLALTGADARALLAPAAMAGKLAVRRAPPGAAPPAQPRAVLRVASRSAGAAAPAHHLEPFLHELQNDVARLSRAFATLGREANALVRTEAEFRARFDRPSPSPPPAAPAADPAPAPAAADRQMSRSARRRMRQRLREALRVSEPAEPGADAAGGRPPAGPSSSSSSPAARSRPEPDVMTSQADRTVDMSRIARPQAEPARSRNDRAADSSRSAEARADGTSGSNRHARARIERASPAGAARASAESMTPRVASTPAPPPRPAPAPAPPLPPGPSAVTDGPSQTRPADGNPRNKKKRRQRR